MNVERYTRPDGLDVVRATACRAGVDTVPAKVETVEITEDLYAALAHALPGGTLDALFAVMARDRASVLRVLKPPVAPSGG